MEEIKQGKMLLAEWQRLNKAKCYQDNGRDPTRQDEDSQLVGQDENISFNLMFKLLLDGKDLGCSSGS